MTAIDDRLTPCVGLVHDPRSPSAGNARNHSFQDNHYPGHRVVPVVVLDDVSRLGAIRPLGSRYLRLSVLRRAHVAVFWHVSRYS